MTDVAHGPRARSDIPVLIVGAGPTGLTLAADLARRGVDFRIIDKTPVYFAGSRGKGLQPRTLEVFDDLGIVDRVIAHGRFHLPFRGYDGATVLGDLDLHEGRHPTPDVPYASSLIIPQWRVEETLRELVTTLGARVELATELVALEQDERGVTATVQSGDELEQVRAEYLVGADGGRSFVRKWLNVGFEGETWSDERMLVGDVRATGLDRDHWHSWPKHPDGWVALCPLPSTDAFQFQAQIAPGGESEPSLELFQRIITERTRRTDIVLCDPTWLSLYRANVRMVDRYRVGRIFIAGDAAHVHSPAGGQGMNTGIQDAYNLAWKLAAALHGAPESLLDTYEEERLPIAAWLLGITTALHHQTFRDELKAVRRDGATLQLGLNYRGCSLSVEHDPPVTPLRAGDRAPDAPLREARGEHVRLFDLFRGPCFTLLGIGAADDARLERLRDTHRQMLQTYRVADGGSGDAHIDGDSTTALIDADGHARNAYGAADGALFLIRPDGYIGLICRSDAIEEVEAYLRHIHGHT